MIRDQQKLSSDGWVTTILFDHDEQMIHDRIPLSEAPKLTERDYRVGGSTALYDAIGTTIRHIERVHHYLRPEDIPRKVVFVVTTDGMENASRQFSGRELRALVEKKKEEGWEFIFLAANIDAEETAESFGFDPTLAVDYLPDAKGTKTVYRGIGKIISNFMKTGDMNADCLNEVRMDYKKRK